MFWNHPTMWGFAIYLLSFGSIIRLATSDAFVSLRFLTFWNPRGRGSNGHCCDGKFFFCGSQCDHSFTICLDRADGVADSVSYCSYGKTVSREIANANHITFGDRIGVIANPVVFRINSWPGRARLKIHVVDVDEHTFDDDVDFLQTVMTLSPVDGRSRVHFTLKNRVQLAIDAQIYCGHHYYGSSCSQYCAPRDDFVGHYTCDPQYGTKICLTGWTGSECNTDEDNCINNSCQNGGRCNDLINRYECICPVGFKGSLCQQDVDECENQDVCVHGVCLNTPGSFVCKCNRGYTGDTCSVNVDDCLPSPCHNGAICHDLVDDFLCSCPDGFTGKLCDEDINECQLSPCKNNGTCVNTDGGHHCDCLLGFHGNDCSLDVDECNQYPCKNDGVCTNVHGGYSCQCPMGFEGFHCDIDINECGDSNTTCHNDGICVNTPGSYICQCQSGFAGQYCEIDVNECLSHPCKHKGTCHDLAGSYSCNCTEGYTGYNCEHNINECLEEICKNGGTCTDLEGHFECTCTEFWEGKTCEENINECLSDPCHNDGKCENVNEGFLCVCPTEFIGTLCEADMNECELDTTCQNNSTCINSFGSFTCACVEGWTGLRCEEDINECELGHCSNLGTCSNTPGGFQCECPISWQGNRCQEDVNECAMEVSPCRNNATCHNMLGGFHCECAEGWTGPLCDVDINECLLVPDVCKAIGNFTDTENTTDYHTLCTNTNPGFVCTCEDGWTGPFCNEDIDECLMSPGICRVEVIASQLENSTTYHTLCVNSNPGYVCICQEGWTGELCDEDIDECLENPDLCSLVDNSTDSNALSEGSLTTYHTVCLNTYPGFLCACSEGWAGENCDNEISTVTPLLESTVDYKNETKAIYDTTATMSNDTGYSHMISVHTINTTAVTKETFLNVQTSTVFNDFTNEDYSGNSELQATKASTTNDTTVNTEDNFNITREKQDISVPFYLACTIKPTMEWTINKGLKQMFLDTHMFQGKELTVVYRSQAETFKNGQTATSIYPTVAVNGKKLSDQDVSFVLNKVSHKIKDYLHCPLFLDAVQGKRAFSTAHQQSTTAWYPGLFTACACLVAAVLVIVIVKSRRRIKSWFVRRFQDKKPALSIMNPLYIPADGVQVAEEDSDIKQFWAMNDNKLNTAAENDVTYTQPEFPR